VKQQRQSETLRDVGCLNVQERLILGVKFSAGQDLKVVGMSLLCNYNCATFNTSYFGRYPAMGSARYRWGAWR